MGSFDCLTVCVCVCAQGLSGSKTTFSPTSGGSGGIRHLKALQGSHQDKPRKKTRLQTFYFGVQLVHFIICYSYSFSRLEVSGSAAVRLTHTIRVMSNKGGGKKHHPQPTEDNQESDGERGDELRIVLEAMAEAQERREIAAELRAEKRAEAAKIAEEDRAEARAEAKARRKEGERLRLEEVERTKEAAAKVASEVMRAYQEECEKRAYEQQVALLQRQADISERASETQRLEDTKNRAKDRVVTGMPSYREPEDIEEFLLTSEGKLRAGKVPEGEWLNHMASKLSGKVGASWQQLSTTTTDYQLVRNGVLRSCGYTPKLAGEAFFSFRAESNKGLAADQLYNRGAQLIRRMVAPEVLSKGAEFAIVKPWIWANVGKKCRVMLDGRPIGNTEELLGALQDFLSSDGERVEGQAAVFRGEAQAGLSHRRNTQTSEGSSERKKTSGSLMKCFKCNKLGHKAADCWQGGGAPSVPSKPGVGTEVKIICFSCNKEGHKSNVCPNKEGKPSVSKTIKQLCLHDSRDAYVEARVNGKGAKLLLDSGARMTIVPKGMVEEGMLTGESVALRAFKQETPMIWPMAKVHFEVDGLEPWDEVVAVAPEEEGKELEILYGLELRTVRGLDLVLQIGKQGRSDLNRVTTRAMSLKEAQEEKHETEVGKREKPLVKPVIVSVGKEPLGQLEEVASERRAVVTCK